MQKFKKIKKCTFLGFRGSMVVKQKSVWFLGFGGSMVAKVNSVPFWVSGEGFRESSPLAISLGEQGTISPQIPKVHLATDAHLPTCGIAHLPT